MITIYRLYDRNDYLGTYIYTYIHIYLGIQYCSYDKFYGVYSFYLLRKQKWSTNTILYVKKPSIIGLLGQVCRSRKGESPPSRIFCVFILSDPIHKGEIPRIAPIRKLPYSGNFAYNRVIYHHAMSYVNLRHLPPTF